ncbi:hypothetical protein [Arsenicibacter rosenii]|uniref:Uncharacterized protein n=1 Tax=Arsenicibacter rosenii TaxID=1750698 RepID=A0A1S2VMW5_9BACT|nr:hypothetical protein [Arsenicibacter rosenii]OIN59740.1 hypothetical protein BLX24_07725 [Arsenicibacter rosenii]
MKLTWTYYPKGEASSITLTVVYVPALDSDKLTHGGYLTPDNVAYVDRDTYQIFDKGPLPHRRDAFQRLMRIDTPDVAADSLRFQELPVHLPDQTK